MPTKLQSLQDHCARFELQLAAAADPEEARQALEAICGSLELSCRSELVSSLLRDHAESRIRERFSPAAAELNG